MDRKEFFDRHAGSWDASVKKDVPQKIRRILIHRFKLRKGDRVLDVGCGTGILLPFLKKAVGGKGKVVALDYSHGMIRKAEKKYGRQFEYRCENAEKTSLKANDFDAVVCFSVFPHFSRKLKVLREMFRLLKPGGRLIVAHAATRESVNGFHSRIGGPVRNDRLPDCGEMLELFSKARFKNSKIEERNAAYTAAARKPPAL